MVEPSNYIHILCVLNKYSTLKDDITLLSLGNFGMAHYEYYPIRSHGPASPNDPEICLLATRQNALDLMYRLWQMLNICPNC